MSRDSSGLEGRDGLRAAIILLLLLTVPDAAVFFRNGISFAATVELHQSQIQGCVAT
jgi:hypothetical protein